MPTREELYTALRNADKAGDVAAARRLAAYIKAMPAEEAPKAAPVTAAKEEPGFLEKVAGGIAKDTLKAGSVLLAPFDVAADAVAGKGLTLDSTRKRMAQVDETFKDSPSIVGTVNNAAKNAGAGAIRGAGSIGSTLLYPFDKAQDVYFGDRETTLSDLVTGNKRMSRNEERRAGIDAGLRDLVGADPESVPYQLGKLGAELAGTAGAGGLVANGGRAALTAAAPRLAASPRVAQVLESIASNGMRAAPTANPLADLAVRATGGAISGGVSAGLIDPDYAKSGALVGGVLPPVVSGVAKAGSVIGKISDGVVAGGRALVEPLSSAGRNRIAGRVLEMFADDPSAVMGVTGRPTITGAVPDLAEATADRGLAQLRDALRSMDPQIANRIGARLSENNAARVNALKNIAKTPDDREAAQAAVEAQAARLYGQAFKEGVEVTPELQRLAGKSSLQKAEARAMELAQELGVPFQARLKDMRPQYVPVQRPVAPSSVNFMEEIPAQSIYVGERAVQPSIVRTSPNPYSNAAGAEEAIETGIHMPNYAEIPAQQVERTMSIPARAVREMLEIPPLESVPVRDMHTLKMGMDALLSDPTMGIAGREAAAVAATRNRLLDLLPESYQVARKAHIDLNKPVHQMEIGTKLLRDFSSATNDLAGSPKLRAEAFNRSLQDEAKLIRQATGMRGVNKLADLMTPEQILTVRAVADELGTQAAVAAAGAGPGSATAQRMASLNILRQVSDKTGMPKEWAESVLANTLIGKPMNWIYSGVAEPKIQQVLADAMLDPILAKQVLAEAQQARVALPPGVVAKLIESSKRASPLLHLAAPVVTARSNP